MRLNPNAELVRLRKLTLFEREARQQGYQWIAGIDEAGRGPLAGPVVAAACILPERVRLKGINDSKQLSSLQRGELLQRILATSGMRYGVGIVGPARIDEINILQASMEAMREAIERLEPLPDYLLVDGPRMPLESIPGKAIIRGDALSQAIAAASIIAKETRDRIMREYHQQWPYYGFDHNYGYPTREHIKALKIYGRSPIHRLSFKVSDD